MAASLHTLLGTAVLTFAATNLDDLALLIAWSADRSNRIGPIVVGQVLGMAVIMGVSAGAGLLTVLVPAGAIGLLGLVPVGIGIVRLVRGPQVDSAETAAGLMNTLAIAGVTVANGSDNIALYVPIFAAETPAGMALTAATVFTLTGVWIVAAQWLAHRPAWGPILHRWGHRAIPWVLIVLGTGVLYRSGGLVEVARVLRMLIGTT